MKLDLDQLRELIRLLDESNLTEIEVEHDDDRIRVRRDPAPLVGAQATQSVATAGAASSEHPSDVPAPVDENGTYVTTPFVGTFYRAPSPDGEPFVEVGDSIVPGQVLCIVEAMKLMNEIEADISGKIVKILVDNGQPIEYDQTLFLVEKL